MGTLRTLLAISVVLTHSFGYVFVGGRNAVQLFYMISGFLISYVLVEKKAYSSIKTFYINRYLRLYPIYLAVAMVTLVVFCLVALGFNAKVQFFSVYRDAPTEANMLLAFANATLFLQDWIMFSGVEDARLVFSTNFRKSDVVLWEGLLVPQAWTLGVELSFYLIAPFVLVRRQLLVALLILSVLLRMYLVGVGLGTQDPWTYRFFPTELSLFLLGALSHQVLLPRFRNLSAKYRIGRISANSTYFLIIAVGTFWLIPVAESVKSLALYGVFLLLLPLTFIFQSRMAWDRKIGELSYSIYICHVLVIFVVNFIMKKLGVETAVAAGLAATLLSIGFSILLNSYIGKPIERLRSRLKTGDRS